MVNFGLLAAEIVSLVWGTPANLNGFRVLTSLPQRRRSMEANRTLHDIWPSPGLVHYIYIFGSSCPVVQKNHQKFGIWAPSAHIFATKARLDNRKKNLLNSNIAFTYPYNIANFGQLTAEICWRVCRTPTNFNGFPVLAALLHSTLVVGVSQTLRR